MIKLISVNLYLKVNMIGRGVLAHRCKCTYYDKILDVHLDMLCSRTKFCGKNTFFVGCVKNKNKNS
jgi:hypothetical protein